jgi:REP element-mobilizing transposase RayT
MIVGYHLIWTVYGAWLPNDPRGSSSHSIRRTAIADLGELHHGRKRVQPAGREIREFYNVAHEVLKHDFLPLADDEIAVVGRTFSEVIAARSYTCYACAMMPDHVHLLIRRHRDLPETMMTELQEASRVAVLQYGARPASHPIWGGPGWKVYLETADDIRRVVAYINENPTKARRTAQSWEFVKPYDGWLPGGVTRRPAKSQAKRETPR